MTVEVRKVTPYFYNCISEFVLRIGHNFRLIAWQVWLSNQPPEFDPAIFGFPSNFLDIDLSCDQLDDANLPKITNSTPEHISRCIQEPLCRLLENLPRELQETDTAAMLEHVEAAMTKSDIRAFLLANGTEMRAAKLALVANLQNVVVVPGFPTLSHRVLATVCEELANSIRTLEVRTFVPYFYDCITEFIRRIGHNFRLVVWQVWLSNYHPGSDPAVFGFPSDFLGMDLSWDQLDDVNLPKVTKLTPGHIARCIREPLCRLLECLPRELQETEVAAVLKHVEAAMTKPNIRKRLLLNETEIRATKPALGTELRDVLAVPEFPTLPQCVFETVCKELISSTISLPYLFIEQANIDDYGPGKPLVRGLSVGKLPDAGS